MADPQRGPRLPLVQRLGHARQHLHQAFAAAGAVVGKVSRPGIKLMARNGIPRLALPGAKTQLLQARIGSISQIRPQALQGERKLLASL